MERRAAFTVARRLGRRGAILESHMSRKFTSPLIALAALVGAVSLSACNTVEGVGQDVQQAGEAVEQAAEETNDGNPNTP